MSITIPDYEIADTAEVRTAAQLRAFADPPRMTLLDLVLERRYDPVPRRAIEPETGNQDEVHACVILVMITCYEM